MLINIDLKTCSKYIHANEITITNSNKVLDTSLLSDKGKKLFVNLFKNDFYATVPSVDYESFVEEYETSLIPATYSITRSGKKLTLTFSEATKINGINLESYTGSSLDFIKDSAIADAEIDMLDETIDPSKINLTLTSTTAELILVDNFFNKEIFKMLDNSETNETDLWAGNNDGVYKINFTIKPSVFTSNTGKTFTTTDDKVIKITTYTSASETITDHTSEDYDNSSLFGSFDDTRTYTA